MAMPPENPTGEGLSGWEWGSSHAWALCLRLCLWFNLVSIFLDAATRVQDGCSRLHGPNSPLVPHPGDGDMPRAAVTAEGHPSLGHSASREWGSAPQVLLCLGSGGQLEGTVRVLSPPPPVLVAFSGHPPHLPGTSRSRPEGTCTEMLREANRGRLQTPQKWGSKNPFKNLETFPCAPGTSFSPIPQEKKNKSFHLGRCHSRSRCSAPQTLSQGFGQGDPRGRIQHAARLLPRGTAEMLRCRQADTHRSHCLEPQLGPGAGTGDVPAFAGAGGAASGPGVGMDGAG